MIVDEFNASVAQNGNDQNSIVDEVQLEAIYYSGEPSPPPPTEFAFPWWLVVVGAVAVVAARTKKILKKK